MMRLALWPDSRQPWSDLARVVRYADRSGWDGVYVADHFMGDGGDFAEPAAPTLEATALLPALAAMTDQVRIGSLVMGAGYRHPAVLANWAITLDHISGGRAVLGVGAGWQQNEHEQYGLALLAPGERVRRMRETCAILKGLTTQEKTTVHGRHYAVDHAICEPKPVQSPLPLLIGARRERMLRVVADYADEWNLWARPEVLAERTLALEAACAERGRDYTTVSKSVQALVLVTSNRREADEFVRGAGGRAAFAGTPDEFGELVASWRESGADEIVVPDWHLGRGTQREEALDALREAFAGVDR
jgi:alkanesulfonate monooxygenase SsuD/methylene tetrahydromethanopterin reductase-like flavin-dependent oxidoreductase (luciferase family)